MLDDEFVFFDKRIKRASDIIEDKREEDELMDEFNRNLDEDEEY